MSGLKINFGKSLIYGWHEPDLQCRADILGCKVGTVPIQYIGALIGTTTRKKIFWKLLLDKFDSKLANWKRSSLNQEGRRVLVKACLNSLPIYWFQLYRVPKGILNQIERKIRDFFWGDNIRNGIKENKFHLVKWSNVCKQTKKGGLGLDNIQSKNTSLLFKWWWR